MKTSNNGKVTIEWIVTLNPFVDENINKEEYGRTGGGAFSNSFSSSSVKAAFAAAAAAASSSSFRRRSSSLKNNKCFQWCTKFGILQNAPL